MNRTIGWVGRGLFVLGVSLVLVACGSSQPRPQPPTAEVPRVMPKPNGQHKLGASVLPRSGVRAASPSNYITSVGVNLSWGGDPNQVSIAVELGFAEPLDAEDAANAEQALGLFPGAYAPTANPASFTPLQLAAVCDGRWRVTNPNDKALSFRWEVENSTERGLGTVPAVV